MSEMTITSLDPWDEIRSGRADQSGASIYWLYSGIQSKDLKLIATTLKGIIKREDWRRWRWIGQEFECRSLRECLLRHPPKGIGADIDVLRRLIYDDKQALDMLDEALRNPHGTNQYAGQDLYNVQDHKAPTGNSVEAALRRLRKDRPDIHARVLAGEITAHAGMVEARFRKKLTAFDRVVELLPKLTAAERRRVHKLTE